MPEKRTDVHDSMQELCLVNIAEEVQRVNLSSIEGQRAEEPPNELYESFECISK